MTVTRRHAIAIAAALGGAVLFALAIRGVGWSEVVAGVRRIGWGLVPILGLAGLRFVLRAEAWRQCMPAASRLTHRQALAAFLAGDAIGNVTPLGLIASEPSKVFLTRHRLATRAAASSLALDVFTYATSVVAMIGVGIAALLAVLPMPTLWRVAALAAIGALAVGTVLVWRAVGGTWAPDRGVRPRWRARLAEMRDAVVDASAGHPARLWRVFALHALFHICAFVEVFVTLRWLDVPGGPTVSEALVFSALDRVIMVVFKFVPFRIGVDEASSGGMAALLGWPVAAGVALAIAKKVRSVAWVSVGLLLIAAHPAQAAPAGDRPGSAPVHRT
jgi:hypothetical protein